MKKITIIWLSLLLNFIKKFHPLNENIICFVYKTAIIFTLFFKGNLLNKGSPAIHMNNYFIPYYIYSIFNHLKLNYIDFYMILHHLCALNFLCRKKYSSNSINLLHGNLVLADYPNVVSELISKLYGKKRSLDNEINCDNFFIIYKILFGIFNSYFYRNYCLNSNSKRKILEQIQSENNLFADYEWDSMSNFTMIIMYVAIIFKIQNVEKIENTYLNKSTKLLCFSSFFVISRNLLMAGNEGRLINKNIMQNYSNTFNKMSIINIVICYYKSMLKNDLLKNDFFKKKILLKKPFINKII